MSTDSIQQSHKASNSWTIGSWKTEPVKQQAHQKDQTFVGSTLKAISSLPPLAHQAQIEELKEQLAQVWRSVNDFYQVGDCAERFFISNENSTAKRLNHWFRLRFTGWNFTKFVCGKDFIITYPSKDSKETHKSPMQNELTHKFILLSKIYIVNINELRHIQMLLEPYNLLLLTTNIVMSERDI